MQSYNNKKSNYFLTQLSRCHPNSLPRNSFKGVRRSIPLCTAPQEIEILHDVIFENGCKNGAVFSEYEYDAFEVKTSLRFQFSRLRGLGTTVHLFSIQCNHQIHM